MHVDFVFSVHTSIFFFILYDFSKSILHFCMHYGCANLDLFE